MYLNRGTVTYYAYLVFFIYPIEILYQITVLPEGALDSSIKGITFSLFIIQIIFKFNITFFLRGKEIFDRKSIRWNYIRKIYNGRFFWDCFSLLGLLIDTFSINFPFKWITYLLFYTKIFFIIEFDTFIRQYLQLNRKTLAAYQLLRLFLIVLFISNIAACVFYRLGVETADSFNGVNWIGGIPYTEAVDSIRLIYLYSLYWSIATMATVAYGDVTPKNPAEVLYACFIMFIATVSFGYTINQVLDIIGNITSGSARVEKQITAIQRYMRDKNVNEDLRNRVIHYIEYQLMEDKERDKETEQAIINMLPPNIRTELFYEINTFFFNHFEWTKKFSDQFISALSFEIEEINLMEDSILYEPSYAEHEEDISLYYLAKGQIDIKKDLPQFNQGQGYQLCTIKENNFIGLYSFVSGTLIKEILKCKTSVKVFIIRRNKFIDTIQNFSEDLKLWNIYKNRILNQKRYEEFNLYCYNCLTSEHIIEECSLMSRKKTMLDKREKQFWAAGQQRQSDINNPYDGEKQFNRKNGQFQHVSSSQLLAESQKILENSSKDQQKSNEINPNQQSDFKLIEDEPSDQQKLLKQTHDSIEEKNDNDPQDNIIPRPSKKEKQMKSVHMADDDEHEIQQREKSMISTVSKNQSKVNQDSFIHFQEQNIDEHIKHQVYNENETDKWQQRAKIKERIQKKQALQQRKTILNAPADDVLLQIIASIQNVLQQNNMDFNQLQGMSQGFKQQRTQNTSFAPSMVSSNQYQR